MSGNNSNEGALILILGIAAFLIFSAAAKSVGLDLPTFFKVVIALLVILASAGFAWYHGCLNVVWPALLGLTWLAIGPALDYYAYKDLPHFLDPELHRAWWAQWYTKLLGFLLLCGGGYGFVYWQRERY